MTDKKEETTKPSYKRVVPIEYEANGVSLVELLKPDFMSKMEKSFGRLDVVNMIIILQGKDVLSLWHKSSEDAKNKMLTITSKDPETMQRLSEVLGLKGEAHD